MNPRRRLRNAWYRCSAAFSRFVRAGRDLAASARSSSAAIAVLSVPLGEQRPDDHRVDEQHDLVAVGVVRSELGTFVRVETSLEQRAEDRRVDLGPIEVGGLQHRLKVALLERQRGVVVEQAAVEPVHRLEADATAGRHRPEEFAGQLTEPRRGRKSVPQHPREHVVRQQADVVGEHAEDQPVDEVGDRRRVVPALAKRLGDGRERRRHPLGERLPGLPWPQTFRVGERPFQPVTGRRLGQVVELELVRPADAVRPVGADPEPHHVGHDEQRRVLERQGVLPELVERRVEIRPLALVFPREVVALPDVGPAVAAGVPARSSLEAVRVPGRVGLGWRRLAEQATQVDEVLLGRGAFFQLGGPPLRYEFVWCHN